MEARDPHLPPSVRRDDYHDAGREDDTMPVVGGLPVTEILNNDHWMDFGGVVPWQKTTRGRGC